MHGRFTPDTETRQINSGCEPDGYPRVEGRIARHETLVPYQGFVSAKLTEFGDLIIEQDHNDPWCADRQHAVIVRAENVEQFVGALTWLIDHAPPAPDEEADAPAIDADAPPTPPPDRPRDRTAAERARRYGQNKRKDRDASRATGRDAQSESEFPHGDQPGGSEGKAQSARND